MEQEEGTERDRKARSEEEGGEASRGAKGGVSEWWMPARGPGGVTGWQQAGQDGVDGALAAKGGGGRRGRGEEVATARAGEGG